MKKPKKAIMYAHVDLFLPTSEAGELFALAQARGWETHTVLPLVLENGIYRKAYTKPDRTE